MNIMNQHSWFCPSDSGGDFLKIFQLSETAIKKYTKQAMPADMV
jgi:hypothetical protein